MLDKLRDLETKCVGFEPSLYSYYLDLGKKVKNSLSFLYASIILIYAPNLKWRYHYPYLPVREQV